MPYHGCDTIRCSNCCEIMQTEHMIVTEIGKVGGRLIERFSKPQYSDGPGDLARMLEGYRYDCKRGLSWTYVMC